MPATRFEYSGNTISVGALPSPVNGVPPELASPLPWSESVSVVDFNRDGLPDLVQSWQASSCICEGESGLPFVNGPGEALWCGNNSDCKLRSARPILGYLNRGGSSLSFDYQCMDAGSGMAVSSIIGRNAGRSTTFLGGRGVNVLGTYSTSLLLWRVPDTTDPYQPLLARPLAWPAETPNPPSGGCDLGPGFDKNQFYPRWRWEFAPQFWAKAGEGSVDTTSRSYADVDGDGFPDDLGSGAADLSSDLRRGTVSYTRRFSRFERPTAQLVPFVSEPGPPGETLVPKPQPRGMHFFYLDVNGDGIVDLVTHHPGEADGLPHVYPGDGRGKFACDAAKQPGWPCMSGITTDPTLQPYTLVINGPNPPFGDDVFLHDVTGDGLADIVAFQGDWASGNVRLWINRDGRNFDCAGPPPNCSVGNIVGAPNEVHRATFADMNADGIDDLVIITRDNVFVGSFHATPPIGLSTRGTRPGQLVRIHNGVGATTEIQYSTVQELETEARLADREWRFKSPVPQSVVTQIRTRDTKAVVGTAPESAPYAIDRKTRYYYRDPAYDNWKRAFVGFRKIAIQEGDEIAVTESTRWFGACENQDVGTAVVNIQNYENVTSTHPNACVHGSDDDVVGTLLFAKVGKVVGVDRYVPRWLGGTESFSGRFEWSKRFNVGSTRLYDQRPNERSVAVASVGEETTYHFDTNADVTVPILPPDSGGADTDPPPPEQPGRRVVTRKFKRDDSGNLLHDAYCGADGENLDASALPEANLHAIVTSARPVPGADPGQSFTCDPDWRCQPQEILVRWATTCAAAEPSSFTRRQTKLSYDTAGDLVKVEGWLDTPHYVERSAFGTADVPGRAIAGMKTLSEIVRDPSTGLPTRILGPGSATSSQRSCTSVVYDAAFGQFPKEVTRHLAGCDSPTGALATSMVFDRGHERLVHAIGENAGVTSIEIDAWGRAKKTWVPRADYAGQSSLAAEIAYHDQAPVSAVDVSVYTQDGGTGALRSVQLLNGLGERVLEFAPDDGGAWVVSGYPDRRTSGALASVKRPFGGITGNPIAMAAGANPPTAGTPTPDFTWYYDPFGRLVDARENGTIVEQRTYLPLAVQTQDAEQAAPNGFNAGSLTETRFDGRGEIRHVLYNPQYGGESTRIDRDAFGLPVKILRCEGDCGTGSTVRYTRSLEYDTLGRLVRNDEPNTSKNGKAWRYAYDDADRLVGTSDARGCGVNLHYDGFGRVFGEDYSPCLAPPAQSAYSSPNLSTGEGLEVWNRFDTYEPGALQPDLTFDDAAPLAAGHVTAVHDRGTHTRFAYDVLGRTRRVDRRVVKPKSFTPILGDGYGAKFHSKRSDYDLAGRLHRATSGTDAPELLLGAGGDRASEEFHNYSARGFLNSIETTYGPVIMQTKHAADGLPEWAIYGDAATTKVSSYYDVRRRLEKYDITRTPPGAIWTTATPTYTLPDYKTTQTNLTQVEITRDAVGNPIQIKDLSSSQWPGYAAPRSQQDITYDGHYRVFDVAIQYTNDETGHRPPFLAERDAGDTRPVPLRDPTTRPAHYQYWHDSLGNTVFTGDDQGQNYDRSTGLTFQGDPTDGPNQLRLADGINARYDEAGNLLELKVERAGTCSTATSSLCSQWFAYGWDEVGQLVRARRWDFNGPLPVLGEGELPAAAPTWDLAYAYSLGARVLKSATEAAGPERHTLEIFDSLRLERTEFQAGTEDYDSDGRFAHVYLASGLAHAFDDTSGALPRVNGESTVHMYLTFADHLGSASFVIDHDSSEVVESVTHQPFGAIENDFRPTRWASHREDYKFTGKEEDIEVGLTYFGARYYQARLGRWASADPLTIHGLGADLNPYAYVRGQVFHSIDPWGLDSPPPRATNIQRDAYNNWSAEVNGQLEFGHFDPAPTPAAGRPEVGHHGQDAGAVTLANAVRGSVRVPIPYTNGGYVIPNRVHGHTVNHVTQLLIAGNPALRIADAAGARASERAKAAVTIPVPMSKDPDDVSELSAGAGVAIAAAAVGAGGTAKQAASSIFRTIGDEAGIKTVEVTVKNGSKLQVMFEEAWEGTTLILRRTHIQGSSPGAIGPKQLLDLARQYARERGAKQIVVEGAKRTTSAHKGTVPRKWVLDVE